jgi:hypothetical protein
VIEGQEDVIECASLSMVDIKHLQLVDVLMIDGIGKY